MIFFRPHIWDGLKNKPKKKRTAKRKNQRRRNTDQRAVDDDPLDSFDYIWEVESPPPPYDEITRFDSSDPVIPPPAIYYQPGHKYYNLAQTTQQIDTPQYSNIAPPSILLENYTQTTQESPDQQNSEHLPPPVLLENYTQLQPVNEGGIDELPLPPPPPSILLQECSHPSISVQPGDYAQPAPPPPPVAHPEDYTSSSVPIHTIQPQSFESSQKHTSFGTNQFVPAPSACSTTCSHCGNNITTRVKYGNGKLVWITVIILFLFGCWPCCIIPFVLPCLKDVHHYCPNCNVHLGCRKKT